MLIVLGVSARVLASAHLLDLLGERFKLPHDVLRIELEIPDGIAFGGELSHRLPDRLDPSFARERRGPHRKILLGLTERFLFPVDLVRGPTYLVVTLDQFLIGAFEFTRDLRHGII